jgi:hypothetical protein
VGEAEDGRQALALARELIPDVVLMGIRMPEFDGLEATLWGAKTRTPPSKGADLQAEPSYHTPRAHRRRVRLTHRLTDQARRRNVFNGQTFSWPPAIACSSDRRARVN